MNTIELIKRWQDYFEGLNTPHTQVVKDRRFEVNYKDLCQYDTEVVDSIFENPEDSIKGAETALKQIYEMDVKLRFNRFGDYPSNTILISEIRSNIIGKLKSIKGIIKQASVVAPLVLSSKFECPTCGAIMIITHNSGIVRTPERCSCGRKGKFLRINEEKIDSQRIVLQEDVESIQGNNMPKEIGVLLYEDLCQPDLNILLGQGNRIAVTGIIKDLTKFTPRGESVERAFIINANSVEPLEEQYKETKITDAEIREIKELSTNPNLVNLMVQSYCPEIYGNEKVKLGIILQLFGGRPIYQEGRKICSGIIHLLLIGDPSEGKTTLSKFLRLLSPKYQYAVGKGSTGRGLTAYAVKDEILGAWCLQAGSVVLASGGICVVDEVDKMDKEEQQHLSECMSDQTVTISKAVKGTLKAETSVLACANFKDGRFNPYLNYFQQIDFPIWMINRITLIFVLRDVVDLERDKNIVKTVIRKWKGGEKTKPEISLNLLKKYIIYSKENIFPSFTTEAELELENMYMGLRKTIEKMGDEKFNTIPINTRVLENIMALSQAAARMRLSNQITKQDVLLAKDVLFFSLKQIAFDVEKQTFDTEMIEEGISTKTLNVTSEVAQVLKELSANYETIPIDEIIKKTNEMGIDEYKTEEAIERLRRSGDYYEPRRGFWKKI